MGKGTFKCYVTQLKRLTGRGGRVRRAQVSKSKLHDDGLGHKPSNSELKKKKFNKMTRDQVLHHVQILISGSTNQNRRNRHLLKSSNSTALLDSWHNPFKSGSSYVSRLLSWTFCAASSRPTEIDVLCPMCLIVFIIVLKKMPVQT